MATRWGRILKVLTAPQGGATRDSEAGGSQQRQKKQKTEDDAPATRTARTQFQKLCSEETVASNRLREGDGVEYQGHVQGQGRTTRRGTVRFWGEGNAWAIADGQGQFFDDPLVWVFETEDGAYPKNNKEARNAAERKKRSIFFTRDGRERWCPFKAPKDPSKILAAAGPAPGSSDALPSTGGGLDAPSSPRVLREATVPNSLKT